MQETDNTSSRYKYIPFIKKKETDNTLQRIQNGYLERTYTNLPTAYARENP
jgi:hypothetical protein